MPRAGEGAVSAARRGWSVLVNGRAVGTEHRRLRDAVFCATFVSLGSGLPVALCRLGDARYFRRFEAGREVTT